MSMVLEFTQCLLRYSDNGFLTEYGLNLFLVTRWLPLSLKICIFGIGADSLPMRWTYVPLRYQTCVHTMVDRLKTTLYHRSTGLQVWYVTSNSSILTLHKGISKSFTKKWLLWILQRWGWWLVRNGAPFRPQMLREREIRLWSFRPPDCCSGQIRGFFRHSCGHPQDIAGRTN